MDEPRPPDPEPAADQPAPPAPEASPPVRLKRRRLSPWRVALLILFVIAAACLLTFGYFYATSPMVRALSRTVLTGKLSPQRAFAGRQAVTLLILGRDIDVGRKGQVLETRGRTDLILATRLAFDRRRCVLVSIPRDLLVEIPGHPGLHKINAAHAYGGPELTCRTVAEDLGIRSDHYLVLNYGAVAKAIDVIGGVSVYVDQRMDYDDNWGNLHIHLKPGRQRLDGRQAVGFARYRKSNSGRGTTDLKRIERQHRVATALAAEIRQPRTWLRLPRVLELTRQGVTTDLSFDQLACLAWTLMRLPQGAITARALPVRWSGHNLAPESDASDDYSYLLEP